MGKEITLPAWLYDALEKSAETYGGIGSGSRFDGDAPCCIIGHADVLDGISTTDAPADVDAYEANTPALSTLREAFGLSGFEIARDNDNALFDGYVSFSEWCKRLNVVRGEEVTV